MTVYEFGQKTSQLHDQVSDYVANMDMLNLVGLCTLALIVGFISFSTFLEMKE